MSELDALRGIAALSVVFYHYFHQYEITYGHAGLYTDWSKVGFFGVHLFFIISGFVIFWSIQRIQKPQDFIFYRFSRLFPVYWLGILITFSIVSIFGLSGREVSWTDALINLTMLQSFLNVPHVDGVYWTLTLELVFYCWIFALYTTNQLHRVEYVMGFLILISIAVSLLDITLRWKLNKFLLLNYAALFSAGIAFYKLWSDTHTFKTYCLLLLSWVSLFLTHSLKGAVIMSLFFFVFFWIIYQGCQPLKARWIIFLGTISYPLYLIHQNIGYVIIRSFYQTDISPIIAITTAVTIAVILASVMTYYIERPCLAFLRNWYKQKHPSREHTPHKLNL